MSVLCIDLRCTAGLNVTNRGTINMERNTRTTVLAVLGALAVGALMRSNKVRIHTGATPAVRVDRTVDVQVPVGKTLLTAAALAGGAMLVSKVMQGDRMTGRRMGASSSSS